MKMKSVVLPICLGLLSSALAGPVSAGDPKIEQALRDLDAQWSAAAAAKDLDKTLSFYASDAVVLPPNAATAATSEAIRNVWKEEFAGMVSGSWKPSAIEVSKSGDMARVSGTYEFTAKDASGKTVADHGKYLEVWQKQADGTWKCGADAWSSDLPAVSDEKK